MKFNLKKNWYYLVPVVLGAYLIYRQFSKKNDPKGDAPEPLPIPPPAPPAPTSDFPLSKGSKNSAVETLQETLNIGLQAQGVTPLLAVDGDFGSKTLAALQRLAGTTTIKNQVELDSLRAKMIQLTELGEDLNWGWKLVDAYNTGTFTKLLVRKPIILRGHTKNFEGLWVRNGYDLNVPARLYNLPDYAIKAVAKDGTLRFEIKNAGTFYTEKGLDLESTFDIF